MSDSDELLIELTPSPWDHEPGRSVLIGLICIASLVLLVACVVSMPLWLPVWLLGLLRAAGAW